MFQLLIFKIHSGWNYSQDHKNGISVNRQVFFFNETIINFYNKLFQFCTQQAYNMHWSWPSLDEWLLKTKSNENANAKYTKLIKRVTGIFLRKS